MHLTHLFRPRLSERAEDISNHNNQPSSSADETLAIDFDKIIES